MKFALYFFAVLSFAGFALVRGVANGGNCTSAECDTDLFCESNVCKVIAGASCANDSDCITGATCPTDDKKCDCGDTKVPKADNTTCLSKVDQTCAANDDCIMGASCTVTGTKKCTCPNTTVVNAAKDKCLKYVGGQCTTNTDCANSAHTDCTGNKCTCKTNYTGDENSACKLKLDQNCTNTDDCYGKNAECKTGTPKKCACKTGFFADGQYCAKKVGETCTVKEDCPMNGECKETKCACMANYKKADNGFCISESSGSAVVGSVLMLLVAFVTSRLL